jgi:hypothetical protein
MDTISRREKKHKIWVERDKLIFSWIEHHDMKMYGSGGIALHILSHGTRQSSVACYIPRLFNPRTNTRSLSTH